jgi:hypothetical protein
VPGLIYISLGSTEIRDYFPVYHQPRYLILFLPGLALMAGWMIGQLWQWRATGRWAVVVMALLMLKPTLTGPDELAGRAYNARTFAGGYDLAERHLAPAGRADRLIASAISRDRFVNLHHWSDCPPVERIDTPAPRTQEQWIERYAGAYVLTTWKDRRGPYDPAQASSTLHGAPMESLSRFEHVARYEPARSRLQLIRAHLLGRPVPTEPARAVDLWRVPARGERRSESPAGAGGSLGGSPRVANAGHKES